MESEIGTNTNNEPASHHQTPQHQPNNIYEVMDSLPLLQWDDLKEVDGDDTCNAFSAVGQQATSTADLNYYLSGGGNISAPIHEDQGRGQQNANTKDYASTSTSNDSMHGFRFNGNINDLPQMPIDDIGQSTQFQQKLANSNAGTRLNHNSWGEKPLMQGDYNQANSQLAANSMKKEERIVSFSSSIPVSKSVEDNDKVREKNANTRKTPSNSVSNVKKDIKPLPPFMLFDAPCELRYNYAQSQQKHNIPLKVEANDLHYGVPVNGFHPQLNAQENPPVQMLDARHCRKQKKSMNVPTSERNEREQKRAHKITELIEALRVSMIDGGWNVQIKSKFHTLSTCQDYVRHLVKTNNEMEEKIRRLKQDAELKNIQIGASEAESISSFASEATIARKRRTIIRNLTCNDHSKRRKHTSDDLKNIVSDHDGETNTAAMTDTEATIASVGMSNIEKNDNVPLLIRPESAKEKSLNHTKEWNALQHIRYDDVFMESSIPQLVAATSGRIISWNKALLKIAGVTKNQIRNLTLFSLVELDHLPNLFSLVGKCLKNHEKVSDSNVDATNLPCIAFESQPEKRQLFMNVTLVRDQSIGGLQCLHCVLI